MLATPQGIAALTAAGKATATALTGIAIGIGLVEAKDHILNSESTDEENNPGGSDADGKEHGKSFDQAREEAFEKAGMTDPSDVTISKTDETTGTATEFKGPGGAKVGYDGPHQSPGPHHDSQHISWQSGGKRGQGGAQRGNIPYDGDRHPSRSDRKDQ